MRLFFTEESLEVLAGIFDGLPAPTSEKFQNLCRFCMENEKEVLASLPWLAAELARNEGFPTMLAFVRRWSGARLYVHRDRAEFIRKFDFEVAMQTHRQLVHRSGLSAQLEVPSAWGVFLAVRRVAIRSARDASLPRELVARSFGVTTRSLR